MPRVSVWMVRAALIHLVIGSTIGAWLLAAKGGAVGTADWLLPLHAPIVLVGWMVQVTIGVGYWILPRFATGAERGSTRSPWVIALLLNLGVMIIAAGHWLSPAVTALGIAAAGLGVVVFVATVGPRVKAFGTGR